tara:strand:+ start:11721 stop:12971 length:1251 start_codon:yes stop_codon:yes gene_type:complete
MNPIQDTRWSLLGLWMMLCSIGLVAIYSATQGPVSQFLPESIQSTFSKQLLVIGLSVVVMIVIQFLNPRVLIMLSRIAYPIGILLMIATLWVGKEVNGAQSWIVLFGFNLQTGEVMKPILIMATAFYISSQRELTLTKPRHFAVVTGLFALPIGLLLLQNDLGTALIFVALYPVILFWSGFPKGIILLLTIPPLVGYAALYHWGFGLAIGIVLTAIIFSMQQPRWQVLASLAIGASVLLYIQIGLEAVLQPYQVARIRTFIQPELDPQGAGWNVLQAKTALGSGGLFGKGFMEGTQTQLRYLPEQWTDFIFCVIGEEWGFLGAGFVLMTFLGLFWTMLQMMGDQSHPYSQTVILGFVAVYFFHFLINIGSSTGLLPVIGVPLPFVSYGGSSMLTNSIMIAIALNFDRNKRSFSIYR